MGNLAEANSAKSIAEQLYRLPYDKLAEVLQILCENLRRDSQLKLFMGRPRISAALELAADALKGAVSMLNDVCAQIRPPASDQTSSSK